MEQAAKAAARGSGCSGRGGARGGRGGARGGAHGGGAAVEGGCRGRGQGQGCGHGRGGCPAAQPFPVIDVLEESDGELTEELHRSLSCHHQTPKANPSTMKPPVTLLTARLGHQSPKTRPFLTTPVTLLRLLMFQGSKVVIHELHVHTC